MTFDEFVNKYNGKSTDYDGGYGVQCVDLIKLYAEKVLGVKIGAIGNAHAYYDKYEKTSVLKNNFTRIANTPSFVPQKGDIAVWNKNMGNGCGHVSVCTGEGTTTYFYSYDQNWNGKAMKKVKHTYNNFYGVIRPKNQANINPYTTGTYQTTSNIHVRSKANVFSNAKTYKQLTANARAQNKKLGNENYNGYLKGVICSVTEIKNNWGKTASGWIYLDYCKKQ